MLQTLLITWLQAQKHTWVHNPNANLKTHVQGKQVYGVASSNVNLVQQSNLVCVYVCVCAYMFPRPKDGNKTSFGIACSFLPLKLRNLRLHNL
jgi:hypothetical protein